MAQFRYLMHILLIVSLLLILPNFAAALKWLDFVNHSFAGNGNSSLILKTKLSDKSSTINDKLERLGKRATGESLLHRDEGRLWVFKGFEYFKGCPGVLLDFQVFSYFDNLYAVIVTKAQENNTQVYSFSLDQGCGDLLITLQSRSAFETTIVQFNDEVRIIVSEQDPAVGPHNHAGSPVYLLSFNEGAIVAIKEEKLLSEHPSSITTWVQYGVPHLAVCNSRKDDNPSDAKSYWMRSYIFCASGGYFDKCAEIESYNPQKIVHFEVFTKHYLAVANYPRLTDGFNVPTEILRHDLTTGNYEHLQYLPTKGAMDVCFFTLGSGIHAAHFLVVVNHVSIETDGELNYDVKSHIYKFVDEKFEPFQAIPTREATSCLSYQSSNGVFFLAFAESSGATLYQYDGWNFVSTTQYTQHAMGVGATRFRTFQIDDLRYISVANSNPEFAEGNNIFLPRFETQQTLSNFYDEAHTWCKQAQEEAAAYPLTSFIDIYRQSVKKNDTDIALNNVSFQSLVEADLVATNEYEVKENNLRLGAGLVEQLQDLGSRILDLVEKMKEIDRKNRAAIRTEGEYVINGPVTVNSISSSCSFGCQIRDVSATQINDIVVEDLFNNAILLTDADIDGALNLQYLQVEKNIETGILNGKDVESYLRTGDDINFTGTFKVEGTITVDDNVVVGGDVNGVELTRNSLLLKQGDQELDWQLKAQGLRVENLQVSFVNNVDVNDFLRNAVNRSGDFVLVDPIFRTGFTAESFKVSGSVNHVDLEEMRTNAMRLEGDQTITGLHSYDTISSEVVIVDGDVNEFRVPDDFVVISSGVEVDIQAALTLLQDTQFKSIDVKSKLADISVTDGQLDVLLTQSGTPQVFTGRKTFETVKLGGVVTAQSVNGFPLEFFQSEDILHGNPEKTITYNSGDIRATAKLDNPVFVGDFVGIDLERLRTRAVSLELDNFPPYSSVTLENSLKIQNDLGATTINGVPVADLVIRDSSRAVISGKKTFTGGVTILEPFSVEDTVNEVDLSAFWEESLKIFGDQNVDDVFSIEGDVTVGRIRSPKTRIGEQDLGEFVRLNQTGMLTGTKRFPSLLVEGDAIADTIVVNGRVDGVDLELWKTDSLMKTGDQKITGIKKLRDVIIDGDVEVENIENLDWESLKDVVLVNQPDVVNTDVEVGSLIVESFVVDGNIDGVDSSAPLFWLLYDEDQEISESITAKGNLQVRAFYDSTWMVNAVNVSDLLYKTYNINQAAEVDSLTFDIVEADNIDVGGTVQGLRIPDDFVLLNPDSEQEVKDVKIIEGPVNIDSLNVDGQFAGRNPLQLCSRMANFLTGQWTVRGNVIVKGATSIAVSEMNDIPLEDLASKAWFKDREANLSFGQQFQNVNVDGDIQISGTINNIDLKDLYNRYVSLVDPDEQEIGAVHNLQSAVFVDMLDITELEASIVNNVELPVLEQWTLRKDIEQEINNRIDFTDVVADSITLSGLVNGVNIIDDTLRKDRPNTVTGQKTIAVLDVEKDIDVCDQCRIDGVDISDWNTRAVLNQGDFTITGQVTVDDVVVESVLRVGGRVNGLVFDSSHLMTLNGNQTVHGSITFSAGSGVNDPAEYADAAVHFDSLQVDGVYSDVDLERFFTKSVKRNSANDFTNSVSLTSISSTGNIQDSAAQSTIRDILETGLHPSEVQKVSRSSHNSKMTSSMGAVKDLIIRQGSELKTFEEVNSGLDYTIQPEAIYGLKNGICFSIPGQLYCTQWQGNSFTDLWNVGNIVKVTAIAESNDLAISIADPLVHEPRSSLIVRGKFEQAAEIVQQLELSYAADVDGVVLDGKACFVFVDAADGKVLVNCKAPDEDVYSLADVVDVKDAKEVKIIDLNGTPIMAVLSVTPRASSRIILFKHESSFTAWKYVIESQLVTMDSICFEDHCYIAGLAPSLPGAYSGHISIWKIDTDGNIKRLQRISVPEAMSLSFAKLPNGRLSLFILQCGGLDNVIIYLLEGSTLFRHSVTIRTPGAFDLHVVSAGTPEMALVVASHNSIPADSLPSLRVFRPVFIGLIRSQFDF